MLTIKMLSDKSLVVTQLVKLYQRQSLVDNMQILVNPQYNDDVDLTNYNVSLEYIDPANVAHIETLEKDEELYNETFLRYTLPIDSHFTYMAGDILMKLTFTYFDEATSTKYVLKTGELTITISKLNDYFAYADESSIASIDAKIMQLQAETDKLAAIAGEYSESQPDDLVMSEDALLQLSANGKAIGEGVLLASPVEEDDDTEDGVIDLDDSSTNNTVAIIDL